MSVILAIKGMEKSNVNVGSKLKSLAVWILMKKISCGK